jgi:hypothetical protein
MLDFSRVSQKLWDKVPNQKELVAYDRAGVPGHRTVLENFANAVLHGEPVVAQGVDGIRSLTLANAIMFSSFLRRPVDLPLDADAYAAHLEELIRTSTYQKVVHDVTFTDEDLQKAFGFH